MNHFGDITGINGGEIEPVDVVTFGSPCQDLSTAGKRAGLAGERSSLFLEAVRIIREMRCKTHGEYPAFAVWENVPGAFSSNGGEDFRRVLQELAALCDDTVLIPRPAGRWLTAGEIMGDGYSISWRVMDAQYWGVPQRRRRIALVVDFGGKRAGEILFDPKDVPGDFKPRGKAGEKAAGDVICGLDPAEGPSRGAYAVYSRQRFGEYAPGVGTLTSTGAKRPEEKLVVACAGFKGWAGAGSGGGGFELDRSPTLIADQVCRVVYNCRGNGDGNICPTLTGDHENRVTDYTAVCIQGNAGIDTWNSVETGDIIPTLQAGNHGYTINAMHAVRCGRFVRRLTPQECERLQGFPDGWTDIPDYTDGRGIKRKASDSARYTALGNSIALPQWRYVLGNISRYLPHSATLGSLFDGIGGFPLVWEELHGKGTAVWSSEINGFCIAVTKYRFGG